MGLEDRLLFTFVVGLLAICIAVLGVMTLVAAAHCLWHTLIPTMVVLLVIAAIFRAAWYFVGRWGA